MYETYPLRSGEKVEGPGKVVARKAKERVSPGRSNRPHCFTAQSWAKFILREVVKEWWTRQVG